MGLDRVSDIKSKVDQLVGRAEQVRTQRDLLCQELSELESRQEHTEVAVAIAQTVAKETQAELEHKLEDIATMALETVFDKPVSLSVDFVPKRNKTEAEIKLEIDGVKTDPMQSGAGGEVDVVAFALRVSLWAMLRPSVCDTLILDEPFRNLNPPALQERAGEIIKELSTRLGVQFIVVTHVPKLAETADRVFEIEMVKGVSRLKEGQ